MLPILRVLEHAKQRIIISCWNRVELVVMALRAGGCQRHESACESVYAIFLELRAVGKKSQSGTVAIRVWHQVTCNLGNQKLVVGHIVVMSLNDPIAITPNVWLRIVLSGIQPVIGIACDVEPVAAPAFSIAG